MGGPRDWLGNPGSIASLTAEDAYPFTAFSSLADDLSIVVLPPLPVECWTMDEYQSPAIALQP